MTMQQPLTANVAAPGAAAPAPARSGTAAALAKSVLTLGFAADPIARWFWPDDSDYLRWMPRFVDAFSGRALDHGTADLAPCGRASAFWLPCGIHGDEAALEALIAESIPARRRDETDDFLGQMEAFHPAAPCWHLAQIAAVPAAQGQGLGSALLRHGLQRCDEEGAVAYLESSNPRNVPLYRRFGFEVIGEIRAGSSPAMHPMVREAR